MQPQHKRALEPPTVAPSRDAIMVRIPPEMSDWLDAETERLKQERGPSAKLSDVVRECLHRAMREQAEKRGR